MISDAFISRSLDSVTDNLECTLQEFVASPDEPFIEELPAAHVEILQTQLIEIKGLAENLSKKIKKNSLVGTLEVDFGKITEILLNLNTIPRTSSKFQNTIESHIYEYILLLCYYSISNTLINQLIRVDSIRLYYESIINSKLYSFFYGLQILPSELCRSILVIIDKINKRFPSVKTLQNALSVRGVTSIFKDVSNDLYPQINKFIMIQSYKFVGLPKQTSRKVQLLMTLPQALLNSKLQAQINANDVVINRYVTKLGSLMYHFQQAPTENSLDIKMNSLKNFFNISEESDSLYQIVRQTIALTTDNDLIKIKRPSLLTRIWPTAMLTLLYGPSSVMSIWNNRYVISNFIQKNLIEFVSGLLYNWIWTPLKQVWATVRHDENSSIAMMAKETLPSELNSLSRMVISLVSENSTSDVDLNTLMTQVEHGDLTQFMEIYENQLENPVKNIITGKLIRSLLVQVQKTKVDGSLALDGIDRMLKSQQLVFGVLALLPAFAIVYLLYDFSYRILILDDLWSSIGQDRLTILKSLNNVERMISSMEATESKNDKYYEQGLLTIELNTLATVGYKLVEANRREEWLRDIEELSNVNNNTITNLRIVYRIYHSYSRYF